MCVFTIVSFCYWTVPEKTGPAECAGQNDETSLWSSGRHTNADVLMWLVTSSISENVPLYSDFSFSTASKSDSEWWGYGHICVCCGESEGHGTDAEGDAGPG